MPLLLLRLVTTGWTLSRVRMHTVESKRVHTGKLQNRWRMHCVDTLLVYSSMRTRARINRTNRTIKAKSHPGMLRSCSSTCRVHSLFSTCTNAHTKQHQTTLDHTNGSMQAKSHPDSPPGDASATQGASPRNSFGRGGDLLDMIQSSYVRHGIKVRSWVCRW